MFKVLGHNGMLFLAVVSLGTYIYVSLGVSDPEVPDRISVTTLMACGMTFAAFVLAFFILWIAGIGGYFIIVVTFPLAIFRIVKKMNSG